MSGQVLQGFRYETPQLFTVLVHALYESDSVFAFQIPLSRVVRERSQERALAPDHRAGCWRGGLKILLERVLDQKSN